MISTNSTLSALNSARNRWAEAQTEHALRGTPSHQLGRKLLQTQEGDWFPKSVKVCSTSEGEAFATERATEAPEATEATEGFGRDFPTEQSDLQR